MADGDIIHSKVSGVADGTDDTVVRPSDWNDAHDVSDFIVDEDDMASNSAVKVPSQQSVKAYVDGGSGAVAMQTLTNLCTNPLTNNPSTTGWVNNTGATISMVTTQTPPFGPRCLSFTSRAGNADWISCLETSGTSYLAGKTIAIGGFIKTDTASFAGFSIFDNGGSGDNFSAYHTGGGDWEWITLTVSITNSCAIQIRSATNASAKTAYYNSVFVCVGDNLVEPRKP